MKIMIVTNDLRPTQGGAEASLLALIDHLYESGHQITVVDGVTGEQNRSHLPPQLQYLPCHVGNKRVRSGFFGLKGASRMTGMITSIRELHAYARAVEEEIKPDLIISQKPPYPFTSNNTPCINFVRDLEFITYFGWRQRAFNPIYILIQLFWKRKILSALRSSTAIISNSKYTQTVLQRHSIFSTPISPFIKRRSKPDREISRDACKVLFLSANLSSHKGWDIVEKLANELPHRNFLVAGKKTKGYVEKLPSNVTWFQWVDNPDELFQQAKMLLVPSQWPETFGRVVVEAQRMRVPVLASKVGGLPEAVGDGGLLIAPPSETKKWKDAVELLFSNDQLYETLKVRAHINSMKFETDRLFEEFDKVLNSSKRDGVSTPSKGRRTILRYNKQ